MARTARSACSGVSMVGKMMPCAPTSSTCLTIQRFGSSSRPVAGIRTMTDLPAIASPAAAIVPGSTSHCIHVRSAATS